MTDSKESELSLLLNPISKNISDFDRRIFKFAKLEPIISLFSVWNGPKLPEEKLTLHQEPFRTDSLKDFNKSFICNVEEFCRKSVKKQIEIVVGLLLRSMVTTKVVVRFTDKIRFLHAIDFLNSTEISQHFGILQYQLSRGNIAPFDTLCRDCCNEFALLIFKKLEGNFVEVDSRDFPDPLFIAQLYELHFLFAGISTKQKNVVLRNLPGLYSYLTDIGIPKKNITVGRDILTIDLVERLVV